MSKETQTPPYMILAFSGKVDRAREFFEMIRIITAPVIEPTAQHPVFEAKQHAKMVQERRNNE